MKNIPIIILSLSLLFGKISAQQLSPFAISTSGGFYNNASGMVSFTTGEMSAVATYSSPSIILTQGFQQYWDFGTYIFEYPNQHFSFGIFPNPSSGHFNLLTDMQANKYMDVDILDLMGKEILRISYQHHSGINVESIDLSNAAQGIYLIVLTVIENNNGPVYHSTQKIHIVK